MASIKKPGPWNPQKAEAYVGKGVLRNGGITPVEEAANPILGLEFVQL